MLLQQSIEHAFYKHVKHLFVMHWSMLFIYSMFSYNDKQ